MAGASANGLAIENMKKQVECPICLDTLDDPRLLPCSHTMCYKCIQEMVRACGEFKCPFRDGPTVSQQQIDQLPLNRALKDIIDCLKEIGSPAPKRPAIKPNSTPEQPANVQETKETLNLSLLQEKERIHVFNSCSFGYEFQLSKPIQLLSIEVKVDADGPIVVIITNSLHLIKKSTFQSTAGLKWLKIPIEAEIKNRYCILVYSLAECATFACRNAKMLNRRPVNQICSVMSIYLAQPDGRNPREFNGNQYAAQSIEMHIEIQRENK